MQLPIEMKIRDIIGVWYNSLKHVSQACKNHATLCSSSLCRLLCFISSPNSKITQNIPQIMIFVLRQSPILRKSSTLIVGQNKEKDHYNMHTKLKLYIPLRFSYRRKRQSILLWFEFVIGTNPDTISCKKYHDIFSFIENLRLAISFFYCNMKIQKQILKNKEKIGGKNKKRNRGTIFKHIAKNGIKNTPIMVISKLVIKWSISDKYYVLLLIVHFCCH